MTDLPRTLPELAFSALGRIDRSEHFGYRVGDVWRTLSSSEVAQRVRQLAGALAASGIARGDRVAIVSPTRLEWALTDYAVLSLGAVVVPVYPTLPGSQLRYILAHAGARMALIGGRAEWAGLGAVMAELPDLEEVVSFDPLDGVSEVVPFERFLGRSTAPPEVSVEPGDLASIIYTSGTTGSPKGVLLTHRNIVSNVLAATAACPFTTGDRHMSFLPLSHIFERMVNYYMLWNGPQVYFAGDFTQLKENLLAVRPTVLTAVPRVLEKLLSGIEDKGTRGGWLQGVITRFAVETACDWASERYGEAGRVSPFLALKHRVAEALVYKKVRALLGGRVARIITGGAATPDRVARFFLGAGVFIQPGYGLTESSPVISLSVRAGYRLGTVGRPLPGVEVRIADDGEILVRGPNVMQGYYKNEEATQQALQDGWLLTGDIGDLDAAGCLRITDRKKDLIVTAGGKNVAPQTVEQALCQDPYIAQAVVLGDGKPYVVALLVPNFAALEKWARAEGWSDASRGGLVSRVETEKLMRERVDAASAGLARFETVKRFALLSEELSEAKGELTPTMKVKRRVVAERYRDKIEALYA